MRTPIELNLLSEQTAIGAGPVATCLGKDRNYQLIVTGTGSVSATATVYGSLLPTGPWEPLLQISASGTGAAAESAESWRAWRYTYANLSAISGTNARVTLKLEG